MKPKMNLTAIFTVLSMALCAAGSALGQYATMKSWKSEMNEKSANPVSQLTESNK